METDFHDALVDIEKRFSLVARRRIDPRSNPFAPIAICRALQEAVLSLDFTLAMRAVLYKTWGVVLGLHLRELYDQLREVLAPLQPAASPRKIVHRESALRRPAEGTAAGDKPRPELAEIAETLNKLYRQMQAGSQGAPEPAEFNLDRILAGLGPLQSAPAGRRVDKAEPRAPQQPRRAAHTGSGLSRLISALDRAGLFEPAAAGESRTPALAGARQATLQDVLAVIDAIPVGQALDGAASPGARLAEAVSDRLGALEGGGRRVAPAYRQVLEMAANLFSRARAEHLPASEIDLLLKRLERPLLKLALHDGSFLDSPDHPARTVINLIDQYAVAADDQGKFYDAKLLRFLSLLVDRICAQPEPDIGIYEMVRERLAKVLEPIRLARGNRVFRLQETCEGREQVRRARAQVSAALAARFSGREVASLLPRVLDLGWRQHLVLLRLRRDTHPDAWEKALATLEQLEQRLRHAHTLWPEDETEARALLAEVEFTLVRVNIEATAVAELMAELTVALQSEAETVAWEAIGAPALPETAATDAEPGVCLEELPARLRVGGWWDFRLDGHWLPMQFIWLNAEESRCAFTNRSATQRLELDMAELARQFAAGTIRQDSEQELPLMERSEYSLFDETYRRLIHQTHHDPITGLLNRGGFMQRLNRISVAARLDQVHTLCLLEFDQCRVIYNTCGTEAGDTLLRDLAAEVRTRLRPEDLLAAFTNESFALLLVNREIAEGRAFSDEIRHWLKSYRFRHQNETYSLGMHIGLVEFCPALLSTDEAIKHADSACLSARAKGRNRVQVYESANVDLRSQESLLEWAGRIDRILERDGLYLRCQRVTPIDAEAPLLPYHEILLGIRGERGESVAPSLFIPAVERWQRSHEIDLWVLAQSFAWIRAHRPLFDATGGFSLNLSALSLANPDILTWLHAELGRGDLPTHKIGFEITETTAIDSYSNAQEFIRQIRRYGCTFALDDFGSGFASYSHLKNLRLDALKIDGSFVKEIGNSLADLAMVKSMNEIGHSLGMKTIAEYVESTLILNRLREIGVDYAQGYVIHKPQPLQALA